MLLQNPDFDLQLMIDPLLHFDEDVIDVAGFLAYANMDTADSKIKSLKYLYRNNITNIEQ